MGHYIKKLRTRKQRKFRRDVNAIKTLLRRMTDEELAGFMAELEKAIAEGY